MDWILLLAVTTFVLLAAFLGWSWYSTKRHHESGGTAEGIGGKNDPMSGAGADVRPAQEMQAALDAADDPSAGKKPSIHE